ncbi:MAG TPA: hypothetical protein VLK84_10260 [Longimicrobium sp.]|nr:hypothetical protein [Longimicrobium sp.]
MISRFAVVLVALASAGACADTAFQAPVAFQADLVPVGNEMVGGSVAAVSQGRATEAGISARLGQAGRVVGWEIRLGTCANPGERLGGRGAYPDLTGDSSGAANVERTFINELMNADTRYNGVLLNATDRTTVLACANLERVQF